MRKPTSTAQLRDWALTRHDEGDDKASDVLAKRVGPLDFLDRGLLAEIPTLICGLKKEE